MTTAIFVIVFLLTFVVPRLSGVFKDLGSDLPMTTQILLLTTGFITKRWFVLVAGIAGAVILYRAWTRTEAGAITKTGCC